MFQNRLSTNWTGYDDDDDDAKWRNVLGKRMLEFLEFGMHFCFVIEKNFFKIK